MRNAVRMAAVAVIVLLAACGSSNPRTPSPSPSGAPVSGLCDATHRCLALVTIRGSDNVLVRDITDIAHAQTVGNLGAIATRGGFGEPALHFVSATQLSYPLGGSIVTVPLSGSPATPVAGTAGDATDIAWSPDGSAIVYTTNTTSGIDVHLLAAGADRIVGSTPGLGVGGCEAIASCTLPNWLDVSLAYSPDGRWFSFIAEGFGASFLRVWSADGKLVKSIDATNTTMSAWSGQSLYFRTNGVQVWRDGAIETFLPQVSWIKPSASPGGGKIVYTVRDTDGWAHVYLIDTATRHVQELKAQRTGAVFLTARYIWYQGERACVAADNCGPQPPFHPTNGKNYIYDLQDGTETESAITGVYDVWPHAA
jgi:hypothetical protein